MRYITVILLTLSVSANNYYTVIYSTIRDNVSVFQVENHHNKMIYCNAIGEGFYEEFNVYPDYVSNWYLTPNNLIVDCEL